MKAIYHLKSLIYSLEYFIFKENIENLLLLYVVLNNNFLPCFWKGRVNLPINNLRDI